MLNFLMWMSPTIAAILFGWWLTKMADDQKWMCFLPAAFIGFFNLLFYCVLRYADFG